MRRARQGIDLRMPRYAVEIVTGVITLMIALLTLVPFDFSLSEPVTGTIKFFINEASERAILNVVSNIALFVPLGIALEWTLRRRRCRAPLAFVGAISGALVLSGGVEWMQAYSPSRVSSWVDFVANVSGAAMGAALASTARRAIPLLFTRIVLALRKDPGEVLVKGYVLLLIGFAVMPLTVAVDGVRMREVLRGARFVMFDELDSPGQPFSGPTSMQPGEEKAWDVHLRQRWIGKWALECLSFAMLAWLIFPRLRGAYRFDVGGAGLLTLWVAIPLAVLLSVIQIPLLTRGFHLTDIIVRIFGTGVGLVTAILSEKSLAIRSRLPLRSRVKKLGWIGVAGATTWIVYSGLIPWIKLRGLDSFADMVATIQTIPFATYFHSRFDVVIADVVGILLSFGTLGGLLSLTWHRLRACSAARRCLWAGICGSALALPVEVAQLFIRTRIASVEDVVLAGIAAAIGAGIAARAVHFLKWALADEPGARLTAIERPTWGPADELIATLIDPSDDAPIEPVHTGRPYPAKRN